MVDLQNAARLLRRRRAAGLYCDQQRSRHGTEFECHTLASLQFNDLAAALAGQAYLSSQTSSMRQLLVMLLTIIVQPLTCGCQQ